MSAVQRVVPEHQLLGRRVQAHVHLAPRHVGHQELAQVALVVDPVPHELDVPRQVRLLGQLGEVVHVPADGARRQRLPLGLEERVGVQQHDLVGGVHLSDRREVGRLVVHCGEHPVSRPLELQDPVSLHMRDVPVPGARIHVQQIVGEPDLVLLAQLIQTVQRLLADRLRPAGIQPHERIGLYLEPPHDLHDPGEGPVRPQHRIRRPVRVLAPRRDPLELGRGQPEPCQQLPDVVLVCCHFRYAKVAEIRRSVGRIVGLKNVDDQVARVQYRAVDIEQDDQLLFRVLAAHHLVVEGQPFHPIDRIHPVLRRILR